MESWWHFLLQRHSVFIEIWLPVIRVDTDPLRCPLLVEEPLMSCRLLWRLMLGLGVSGLWTNIAVRRTVATTVAATVIIPGLIIHVLPVLHLSWCHVF